MSTHKSLNSLIHAPARLGILTMLSRYDSCGFTFLRDTLEVSDGNLSSHLSKLEQAGYVRVKKSFVNRKQNSSYAITRKGESDLRDYLEALKSLLQGHDLE